MIFDRSLYVIVLVSKFRLLLSIKLPFESIVPEARTDPSRCVFPFTFISDSFVTKLDINTVLFVLLETDIPPLAPLSPDSPALIPMELEEDVVLFISLRDIIFKSPFILALVLPFTSTFAPFIFKSLLIFKSKLLSTLSCVLLWLSLFVFDLSFPRPKLTLSPPIPIVIEPSTLLFFISCIYVSSEAKRFRLFVFIRALLDTLTFEPCIVVSLLSLVFIIRLLAVRFEARDVVLLVFVCFLLPFKSNVIPAEKPYVTELAAAAVWAISAVVFVATFTTLATIAALYIYASLFISSIISINSSISFESTPDTLFIKSVFKLTKVFSKFDISFLYLFWSLFAVLTAFLAKLRFFTAVFISIYSFCTETYNFAFAWVSFLFLASVSRTSFILISPSFEIKATIPFLARRFEPSINISSLESKIIFPFFETSFDDVWVSSFIFSLLAS